MFCWFVGPKLVGESAGIPESSNHSITGKRKRLVDKGSTILAQSLHVTTSQLIQKMGYVGFSLNKQL